MVVKVTLLVQKGTNPDESWDVIEVGDKVFYSFQYQVDSKPKNNLRFKAKDGKDIKVQFDVQGVVPGETYSIVAMDRHSDVHHQLKLDENNWSITNKNQKSQVAYVTLTVRHQGGAEFECDPMMTNDPRP